MKIRIALAEDNDSLADSIREKVQLFEDEVEFVFRACDGLDLIERLRVHNDIDVVLMDIEMPAMDGIQATRIVAENYPAIKIIMLTVFDDEDRIFRSVQAGAIGYLLKEEPPARLMEAIKIIMDGGAIMSPSIAAKAIALLRNTPMPVTDNGSPDFSLSRRELEVLQNLSEGANYNQIAAKMFVSPSTVRKHTENIYRKLQVHNKIQAVQLAVKNKLI